MACVYILRGSSGRHCIGSTDNLERRLIEHRRGSNHTTCRLGRDIEAALTRTFNNAAEARRVEFLLKRKKNPRLAIIALRAIS
jgi:predicted GIY-YIG superfamily endonuclease